MEVDGAQEWPEWVMPAGAAEQRCEGWAREGEGQVPAGAQGEAEEDLEETEARPLSPKLPKSERRGQARPHSPARGEDGRWGRRQGILGNMG